MSEWTIDFNYLKPGDVHPVLVEPLQRSYIFVRTMETKGFFQF